MLTYLTTNPLFFLLLVVSIVVAIAVHEFAHAKTADYLGDPTPSLQGRVTLDPRAHIDLYGFIFLLLVGFGWGKPVQFDPFNLKDKRRDAALISIAGPMSNIIIATLSSIILRLLYFIDGNLLATIGSILLVPLIMINLILAVFNLIPIHPLDGFKIVEGLLNEDQAKEWRKLERLGFIFLILLVFPFPDGSIVGMFLSPVMDFLNNIFIPAEILLNI